MSPMQLGALRPLGAACTSEGIRRDTGVVSWLHWPNLVTIDGRVVASTSTSIRPMKQKTRVVFNLSVNCYAETAESFPKGLRAASILDVLGVEIERDLLRDKVLHALDWYCAELERGMHRKLLDRMRPTIAWMGNQVRVRTATGGTLTGLAKGLDDQGRLLLQSLDVNRRVRALPAEEVELVQQVTNDRAPWRTLL